MIEKVGWINIREQIPTGVKYNNPRITYDNKYWYISVGVEVEKKQEELTDISLGIDLGLKDLAICSDGQVFKNINKTKKVKKLEKRLKQKQKQISRKYEMNKIKKEGGVSCQFIKTKNIEKLENTTRLIHRKLINIRNNYLHQVTTNIVKTKPYRIVIEDLNVSGIKLVIADRFYPSSKTCSHCGSIKKDLKLKDRVYSCSHCGTVIDRDYNASLNLSMYKLV